MVKCTKNLWSHEKMLKNNIRWASIFKNFATLMSYSIIFLINFEIRKFPLPRKFLSYKKILGILVAICKFYSLWSRIWGKNCLRAIKITCSWMGENVLNINFTTKQLHNSFIFILQKLKWKKKNNNKKWR